MFEKRNPMTTATIVVLPAILLLAVVTFAMDQPAIGLLLPLGLAIYAAAWLTYRLRELISDIRVIGKAMRNVGFVE